MPTLSYGCFVPTSAELDRIQMELFPRYLDGRVGLEIMPFRTTDRDMIIINQPDIFKGMQQFRGLNKPTLPAPEYNPYGNYCEVKPGYWGEHSPPIDEEQMTRWGSPMITCPGNLDITDWITQKQSQLLERRANRIEYNIWQTLVFGRYTALNSSGQIIFEQNFNVQTLSVAIPWTNFAGSFPLRDFRTIQLLGRGTSARFDTCARAYMNRITANALMSNINPNDVGRVGLSACCVFMSPEQINQQFAAQGLPQIVIYDQGYVDDNGTFFPYIPDGYVIIVGCRPNNVPPGYYWLTRNAVGCSVSSGFWQKLHDTCDREVPRTITVLDGHNGGPALEYPRMVVSMRVF